MKRSLLLSALAATLFFSNNSNAQPVVGTVTKTLPKVTIGVKAGVNMQSLSGSTWKSTYNAGILGGAFVGVTKNKIGVQAEAIVKSAKFDVTTGGYYVKSVYLDIPVLFEYKLISRLWLQVGPQFSSLISAKDNYSKDVKNTFNTSDFAGLAGLQLNLPLNLTAGARYVLGFSNIRNTNNVSFPSSTPEAWKNRSIQVYVGFRFI